MARVLTCRSVVSASVLAELAPLVHAGGLLAAPTESSYALCVSPFHARAVERLFVVKGRRETKPILVLIGNRDQLACLAASVPPAAELLMARCWPGPVTMVLPARESLPAALTAGTGTIGIRLPAFPILTQVLASVGPLTGTSANRAGERPLMTAEQVAAALDEEVDTVLDLGPAGGDAPSTVVGFEDRSIRVHREGPVTVEQLEAIMAPAGYRVTR